MNSTGASRLRSKTKEHDYKGGKVRLCRTRSSKNDNGVWQPDGVQAKIYTFDGLQYLRIYFSFVFVSSLTFFAFFS